MSDAVKIRAEKGGKQVLEIQGVRPADIGKYSCVAKTTEGDSVISDSLLQVSSKFGIINLHLYLKSISSHLFWFSLILSLLLPSSLTLSDPLSSSLISSHPLSSSLIFSHFLSCCPWSFFPFFFKQTDSFNNYSLLLCICEVIQTSV